MDAPDVPEPKMRAAPESLPLTFNWGAMVRDVQTAGYARDEDDGQEALSRGSR